MFRRLLEQFELTNRRHSLLKKKEALVVGVSGGPDSLALLELLCKLRRKYALRLYVAHLDHGLQKNHRLVRSIAQQAAERHHLPFYTKQVKIRELAKKNKLSLEDAGRVERYRFFESVAKKARADKIATAHTLDDQAETMLMRLIRGSGLRGLAGIPYKRTHGRLHIVRPLLDCPKKDLILFLKNKRLAFIDDPMNKDSIFLRNRVRHDLLPLLSRRFNPQIKQALASLRTICHESQDYIELQAISAFRRCLVSANPRKIILNISRLKALHPVLRYEALATGVTKLKGDITGFGYAHWEAVDTLLASPQKNLQAHWPHRISVQKKSEWLIISRT